MTKLHTAKQGLFEQFARIGKAVSSAARLQLLDLLAQGEKPVATLARQSNLSVTNTSNHLKELRTAGLVSTRKDGPYVYYRLADASVHEFLRCLQEIARRQLAEVRQIIQDTFDASDSLDPVGADELLDRIDSDDVVLIDVRPEDEFASGHLPGAVSVPIEELEQRLAEFPADREIVAYCRGPYCILSLRALEILRSRGFRARRLEDGVPDWRARGLRVAGVGGSPDPTGERGEPDR